MRGDNARLFCADRLLHRFTPTCVGTMEPAPLQKPNLRFTPTCVGTMTGLKVLSHQSIGSPPHAWGQSIRAAIRSMIERFTPTCVGTMWCRGCWRRYNTVHPHMRGDNLLSPASTCGSAGSPPHAWGQFQRRAKLTSRFRFTPTCVGTMASPACWAAW